MTGSGKPNARHQAHRVTSGMSSIRAGAVDISSGAGHSSGNRPQCEQLIHLSSLMLSAAVFMAVSFVADDV